MTSKMARMSCCCEGYGGKGKGKLIFSLEEEEGEAEKGEEEVGWEEVKEVQETAGAEA
jgi:hypothetical protein